ncbi:MAG: hypothetical protein E5W70_04875 [Mesorhizobium sp.]|uniref:hypothetical protein n=1 Tax=Mesorhizobium sp. TaxID=1871066 RepID=UPI00122231B1|nr:hypothetical protein [Mesorhizobium sp.]TIT24262.1 MAG: hypothetical protein E5W70_04875 [Mesorhizobium sp.]
MDPRELMAADNMTQNEMPRVEARIALACPTMRVGDLDHCSAGTRIVDGGGLRDETDQDRQHRHRVQGKPCDRPVDDESKHFVYCPVCEQTFDARDLGQVFHHAEPQHLPLPMEH